MALFSDLPVYKATYDFSQPSSKNLEKLKIAINYGADAVYGGVSHFSLRIRAGKEFTFETFKEGIDYF